MSATTEIQKFHRRSSPGMSSSSYPLQFDLPTIAPLFTSPFIYFTPLSHFCKPDSPMGPGKERLIKEHTQTHSAISSKRHQKALKSHSSGELPLVIGYMQAQNKQEMSLALHHRTTSTVKSSLEFDGQC